MLNVEGEICDSRGEQLELVGGIQASFRSMKKNCAGILANWMW